MGRRQAAFGLVHLFHSLVQTLQVVMDYVEAVGNRCEAVPFILGHQITRRRSGELRYASRPDTVASVLNRLKFLFRNAEEHYSRTGFSNTHFGFSLTCELVVL